MEQNISKKYFVKDTSLHNVDDDMFNYADISKVLGQIIDTNEPPYNVAVIGKWGLGKSSLINLVTDIYKNKNQQYLVQEINAWKYEKESLGKVFLKQLWQGISGKKVKSFEVIKREFSDIINGDIIATPSKSKKAISRKLFCTAGAITLATIIAFAIYKFVQAAILGTEINAIFWGNMFLSYCKNIATVMLFPVLIGFCKVLLDDYHVKDTKKVELSFPIETTDDYEIFLEEKIKEHLEKAPDLKVITIIDDLDRLSIDKIVEALDALKAFVGFDRCIFIVPFDDEIIKLALDKRRASIFNDKDDIVESELILDKLFQFKIYLPPLLDFDIKKYALDLIVQEIPDFLVDFCDQKSMEKLLNRVIIHSSVSTPRQVKKLINAFINNYMVAFEREASGKVQEGLLTSEAGRIQIAKFSVLQADYNKFYDQLFIDINSIDKILKLHRTSDVFANIPKHLKEYFINPNEEVSLNKRDTEALSFVKPEYEGLINFLVRTEKYKVDSIAPYLYLAQDDISKKTGDETQRRAISALESGNIESIRTMLVDNHSIVEAIIYHLSFANDDISEMLATSIAMFDNVADEYRAPLAQNIIERTLELVEDDTEFLYGASTDNIFAIIEMNDNKDFSDQFLYRYIQVYTHEEWIDQQKLVSTVNTLVAHYDEYNQSQIELLRSVSKLCITSDVITADELLPAVQPDDSKVFLSLWELEWLKKLSLYIENQSDFSESLSANLFASVRALKINYTTSTLIDIILPLVSYSAFLPTLTKILDEKKSFKSKNGEMVDSTFRGAMPSKQATQIANSVIALDFKQFHDAIHDVLNGLSYIISEDNQEAFDLFAENFKTSKTLDDILVYCGRKGYFALLPNTITSIISAVFEDDENDKLLQKTEQYFTTEQRTLISTQLKNASVFASNKNYERLPNIYKIISTNAANQDFLNDIVVNTFCPQLNSYHAQPVYFDFISQTVGEIKDLLEQNSVDKYVEALISRFNSYRSTYLVAINRISGKMSEKAFSKLFPLLVSGLPASDFDAAFDVIINHDSLRPCEPDNLTDYCNFLVSNLSTAGNPNKVIDEISSAFSNISNLNEMVSNALANSDSDRTKLCNLIGKFLDNEKKTVDTVAEEILELLAINGAYDVTTTVVGNLKKHTIPAVFSSIIAKIDDTTPMDVLLALLRISMQYAPDTAAISLVYRALELSFKHTNQTDSILLAIDCINKNTMRVTSQKAGLIPVLYSGFHGSTSEKVKDAILKLISTLKIKPQFKKLLSGSDLEYYKNGIE